MVVIVAGLLAMFVALGVSAGAPGWLERFGAAAALVSLALNGVLQAVDGVALKHAVDAWASAPDTEKAARFANAETVRGRGGSAGGGSSGQWGASGAGSGSFGASSALIVCCACSSWAWK